MCTHKTHSHRASPASWCTVLGKLSHTSFCVIGCWFDLQPRLAARVKGRQRQANKRYQYGNIFSFESNHSIPWPSYKRYQERPNCIRLFSISLFTDPPSHLQLHSLENEDSFSPTILWRYFEVLQRCLSLLGVYQQCSFCVAFSDPPWRWYHISQEMEAVRGWSACGQFACNHACK